MKPPAASPGRAEKPQLPAPAPPGLARLLLSKSRRGGRSRRAPATSPMFVSARGGRSRASSGGAEGEPSSPKVTCIGQVRMRNKGKKKKKPNAEKAKAAKAKGYCRCLKKAFLCGGLFEFDRRRRSGKQAAPPPPPEVEQRSTRRSPWVFSSRDVAVAAAPTAKPADARSGKAAAEDDDDLIMEVGAGGFGSVGRRQEAAEINEKAEGAEEAELVSSATTTPPKNALLLMRCRSAPQNRTSPLTSRFLFPAGAAEPSPSTPTGEYREDAPAPAEFLSPSPRKQASPAPSPSPRKAFSPVPSPSPRRNSEKLVLLGEDDCDEKQAGFAAVEDNRAQEEVTQDEYEEEDEEMRCSSARPLVLQRCKSEPATTAAAKMSAGPAADATTAGCFWAHGGSSGRRRHAPPALALTGH